MLRHREIRVNAEGEIQVRGRTMFDGYLDELGEASPFDAEGWFSTGDLGHLNEAGQLTVIGRKDRQFISGGENILPEEIERELLAMPGCLEAVVVPVSDSEFGARPVAFCQWDDEAEMESKERKQQVHALLDSRLARYKIPVAILDLPQIPGLKPNLQSLNNLAENALRESNT